MRAIHAMGRAVFGGFFLYSGINHFKHHDAMSGYAASKGLSNPDLNVEVSGALLIATGASLVLGVKPKLGALGVAGFLAGAATIFHDFWNVEDPQQRQGELIHFTKDIALAGAALAILDSD